MSIENALLGLLSWRSLTGYDIKKMFMGSPTLYWSGNNNQIYTTLVALHKKGLVSRETKDQEGGPSRKVYSITEKGRSELKKWLLSEPQLPQLRNPFLIRLAWADQLNAEELDTLLGAYEDEIQMALLMLQVQAEEGNINPSGKPRSAYINPAFARSDREFMLWRMIQENWISFYQHEVDWVHKLRKGLSSFGVNKDVGKPNLD